MTPVSSSADGASPIILMFLRLNLFLNLCNNFLLAVKGLVSSSVPFFFNSSYRLEDFAVTHCRQGVPPFHSYFPPRNLRLFSTFINTITRYSNNFCSNTGLQPLRLFFL